MFYHNVKERGFIFVGRFRKTDGSHHFDYHVDYDDEKYDGLVAHARLIKDDYEAEQAQRQANGHNN